MATLYHQVWIDAPIEVVYAAISSAEGIGRWWDEQTEKKVQGALIWEHSPPPSKGKSVIGLEVVERVANRRVVLSCAYAPEDGTAAADWQGTELTFELRNRSERGVENRDWMAAIPARTILDFTHSGWDEKADYLAFCNTAWGSVLGSLRAACEEAK